MLTLRYSGPSESPFSSSASPESSSSSDLWTGRKEEGKEGSGGWGKQEQSRGYTRTCICRVAVSPGSLTQVFDLERRGEPGT